MIVKKTLRICVNEMCKVFDYIDYIKHIHMYSYYKIHEKKEELIPTKNESSYLSPLVTHTWEPICLFFSFNLTCIRNLDFRSRNIHRLHLLLYMEISLLIWFVRYVDYYYNRDLVICMSMGDLAVPVPVYVSYSGNKMVMMYF